jgi:pimeloyl-ACP methyl ester carboxylesterase
MAVAAFALALGAGCSQAGGAGALAAVASPYARPGELVKLPDGRRMNLRCSGEGAPTVLMEAGFGSGSSAWVKVQPELSRTTRVCSYDRAGYGFSDPGPLPRDAAAVARDLDQALGVAGIQGPFVVVGHSAGGMYGRVFAARRPRDIAGLVLLDPTVEHRAPQPVGDGLDGIRARVRGCLVASRMAPQPPFDSSAWSGCLPARPSPHDVEVTRRAGSWEAQLSELDELFGRSSDQVLRAAGQLAGVPTYVITASATAANTPNYGLDGVTQLEIQHQMIAGVSRIGYQRTISSSHLVMIDRPEVVISAVGEMIAAARAHRDPAPLPPGENVRMPDSNILQELFANPRGLLAPPDPAPPAVVPQN